MKVESNIVHKLYVMQIYSGNTNKLITEGSNPRTYVTFYKPVFEENVVWYKEC